MSLRRGNLALGGLILLVLMGIIVPFLIWGERFDAVLSLQGARTWMESYGAWAWAAGVLLLIADIILPIPSTVVMSSMGWMYGWFLGGLVAGLGSFLSGMTAYGFCFLLGRPAARFIAGEAGLRRGEEIFSKSGGWLVALSRWMPVLPEAVACLAGLVKMRGRTFIIALACGSFPTGFAFAAVGDIGQDHPAAAIILSAALPILLWLAAQRVLRHKR